MAIPNTIKLVAATEPVISEAVMLASQAIIPGMLIDLDLNGKSIKHATADGTALPVFAETSIAAAGDINRVYLDGETVRVSAFRTGDEVFAFLKDGQSVTPADFLSSNGDGTFKKSVAATPVSGALVAKPLETVVASGSDARIRIRIA